MTGLVGLGRFSLRLTKRQPKPTICCTLLMTCCGLLMALSEHCRGRSDVQDSQMLGSQTGCCQRIARSS